MWLSRRWGQLLRFIDRLPTTSYYHQALANDEEYAAKLAEHYVESDEKPAGPSLTKWTPEVEMLARVVNELRILNAAFVMANSSGNAAKPKPEMLHGPTTALQRALAQRRHAERERKHQALVARVLPHKRQPASDTVDP